MSHLAAACAEPALIVADDADTLANVARLVDAVQRHDGAPIVRLLLIVRDGVAFGRWLAESGPASVAREWTSTPVGVAGGEGDRRRWLGEALCAFRAALEPDKPFVMPHIRAVGVPGEVMMVTCARAALAAVAGGSAADIERVRAVDSDDIAAQLLEHERRRWAEVAADPQWRLQGTGVTDARLAEAMLALVLSGATTVEGALKVLGALEFAGEIRRAIVEWAQHVYPGFGLPGQPAVQPRPEYLTAVLIALSADPERAHVAEAVVGGDSGDADSVRTEALRGIIRAAGWFPRAAVLLDVVLDRAPAAVVPAIQAAALAGTPARVAVRDKLLTALARAELADDELKELMKITRQPGLARLRLALLRVRLERIRRATETPEEPAAACTVDLANALLNLGVGLRAVGKHREALTVEREAVALYRRLAGMWLVASDSPTAW